MYKYNKETIMKILLILAIVFGSACAYSKDGSPEEKAEEARKDAKRAIEKGARKVEDKTCRLVSGTLKCAAKKAKHDIQNHADEVEDKID
jgi:hypothetical protein